MPVAEPEAVAAPAASSLPPGDQPARRAAAPAELGSSAGGSSPATADRAAHDTGDGGRPEIAVAGAFVGAFVVREDAQEADRRRD